MILKENDVLFDIRNTSQTLDMSREKGVDEADGSWSYQTPRSTRSHRLLICLASLPVNSIDFPHPALTLENGALHVLLNSLYPHRLILHTGERSRRHVKLFGLDCEVGGRQS